jgi:hypothetical protein
MLSATSYRILMILCSALFVDLAQSQEISSIFEGKSVDTVLCDGVSAGPGIWKSRLVQVLEPGNKLELREYQVFDPEPGRSLEFFWKPDNPGSDRSGRVSGPGSLTWRDHARMAWDPAGVIKSFDGDMRDGKPEGKGEFVSADGVVYDGAWRDGRPDGDGQLQLRAARSTAGSFDRGVQTGVESSSTRRMSGSRACFASESETGRGKPRFPMDSLI